MSANVVPLFTRPKRPAAERAFLPAALEIVESPASPTFRLTAALIALFLATAVVWSYFGFVDIVATAPGKVIARARTKIIQPYDAGVVRAINVGDGDKVMPGQVLIELDPTMSSADETRYQGTVVQDRLDHARLAVLAGLTPPKGDPFSGIEAPADLIAAARARLEAELHEEAAKVARTDDEIAEKRAEEAQIEAQIAKLDAALPMVLGRAQIREATMKMEVGSKIAYFEAEQQVVETQHERIVQQKKGDEVKAAIAALNEQRAATAAEFRHNVLTDLARVDHELAEATSELAKAAQKTTLQRLTAPVEGVVQDLSVHTLGGVVTPAQQLLRIVPSDGRIEVEAVVANQDVGFVAVGQEVEIKIDTFPFTRYGLIHGHVRAIAHDAVDEGRADQQRREGSQAESDAIPSVEQSHRLVYTVRIALDKTSLDVDGTPLALEPGMAVTAEIKTGRRRVLDFLLSPFHRYRHDALRER